MYIIFIIFHWVLHYLLSHYLSSFHTLNKYIRNTYLPSKASMETIAERRLSWDRKGKKRRRKKQKYVRRRQVLKWNFKLAPEALSHCLADSDSLRALDIPPRARRRQTRSSSRILQLRRARAELPPLAERRKERDDETAVTQRQRPGGAPNPPTNQREPARHRPPSGPTLAGSTHDGNLPSSAREADTTHAARVVTVNLQNKMRGGWAKEYLVNQFNIQMA